MNSQNDENRDELTTENKEINSNENEIIDQTKTEEKEKPARRINVVEIIFIVILSIAVSVAGLYYFLVSPAVNETFNYNNAVSEFNKKSDIFNEAITKVNIDNVSGIASHIDKLPTVNTSLIEVIKSIKNGNNALKIKTDINSINTFTKDIDEDMELLKQIENPSKEWVIDRLKTITMINGTEAVSKENDPNELLKKEDGGYQECIYFTLNNIKQDEVEGDTIVDRGTDAGGAIEVYATKEDAEQRCEYLADFDNSILYSGSYVPFGTMVIRVSYILNDEQQCYVTDLIVDVLSR